jgi:hypothetical protein
VVHGTPTLLGDPDEGSALRGDFAKSLQRSLDEVSAVGPTRGLAEVTQEYKLGNHFVRHRREIYKMRGR